MMGTFVRLRRVLRETPSSPCLERGEVGLDGLRASPSREERRARRGVLCRMSVALFATVCFVCFLIYGVSVARTTAVGEVAMLATKVEQTSPCTHFRTDWLRAVVLYPSGVTMTSPRVVSRGSELIRTAETLSDQACRGKKIIRERHVALSVAFVPLERWPWGAEQYITLKDAAAVCLQHALEDFEHSITCETD